MSDNKFLAY